ncbi:VID27 cytoplasmic protein-domain-containing protein [Hyaloraphidium curvatum]|nr:VID27 cytoplasmic protein-domain-containing protein [Hyaloraphidium curvatum]
MSFLSKIASIFSPWNKSDSVVFTVPHGGLFLTDPSRRLNPDEQIYLDARLLVRKTSEPFNYQLVAERIPEEGAENIQNVDELFDEERAFLIDESMGFRVDNRTDEVKFSWLDLAEGRGKSYSFYPDVGDRPDIMRALLDEFVRCVYRAMYERRNLTDAGGVRDEDLAEFALAAKAAAGSAAATPAKAAKPGEAGSAAPTPVGKPGGAGSASTPAGPSAGPAAAASTPKSPAAAEPPSQELAIPPVRNAPVGSSVVKAAGDLYQFDPRVNQFHLRVRNVTAEIQKVDKFKFWFSVMAGDKGLISQAVEQRMNPVFSHEHLSFVWCYFDEDNQIWSWSIRFNDATNETAFREMFGQCLWETLNESSFAKVKSDEQKYILDGYRDDVEMEDNFYDLADEEDEREKQAEGDRADAAGTDTGEQDESEESEEDEEAVKVGGPANVKNSSMAVGQATDRSFVVRGDRIGVFKYGDNDKLQFVTAITDVRESEKQATFTPSKIMLHQRDRDLLMMKPGDEHNIYRMDLERGQVVEKWNVDEIVPLEEIAPAHKYDQKTNASTINGLNHNSLFVIDPRVSGAKRVAETSKQYTTKQKFSSMATTGQGYVAVGSEKGEIRMFDKIGINAKTMLPGFGDPIIGIDVTEKGDWILATCKDYLLLINTSLKGTEDTGFNKRMGEQKPMPIRLKLRPEHVAFMGVEVSFTRARFNTGEGDEKYIVTGTGPFVVTWNFRRVKAGKLYDYVIKKYTEDVVTDDFRPGQGRSIVVTLPNDVTIAKSSELKDPVKLLQTPAKNLKSRSSIVNSPY